MTPIKSSSSAQSKNQESRRNMLLLYFPLCYRDKVAGFPLINAFELEFVWCFFFFLIYLNIECALNNVLRVMFSIKAFRMRIILRNQHLFYLCYYVCLCFTSPIKDFVYGFHNQMIYLELYLLIYTLTTSLPKIANVWRAPEWNILGLQGKKRNTEWKHKETKKALRERRPLPQPLSPHFNPTGVVIKFLLSVLFQ